MLSIAFVLGCIVDIICFCFFKQKTAYEMRISDWSSDVCSSDLRKCVCRAIGPGLGDDRANRDAEAKFQIVRNKSLPPSQGVGIWIEAFGFVHPPSQHIGPPFEQRLVRVGAAHPEAEPAVSGEQVADRLEDIDTRRRPGPE